MSETTRPPSPTRCRRFRPWFSVKVMPPDASLSSLVTLGVMLLLIGLLLMFVVREIRDGALTGCPAYDGVTHRREAEALCADQ